MKKIICCCIAIVCLSTFACKDDESEYDEEDNTANYPTMNEFIYEKMNDVYLWADEISDKNVSKNQNPYNYVKQMRYSGDGWSYVDSLYSAAISDLADTRGFSDGYGYSLQFYYSYLGYYLAVVNYVYPGTPAYEAGMKRGDVILKKDGESLSELNYRSLLTDRTLTLSYVPQNRYSWGQPVASYRDTTITMVYSRTDVNPILVDTIFTYQSKKIAYMHYTEFMDNQTNNLSDLSEWATRVKNGEVDEVIIDLRYNGGGYVTAAAHFASLLAPKSVVTASKVMIKEHWNKKYNTDEESQIVRYKSDVSSYNLDLDHVTFIVSERTASASEFLMSVLMPYMDQVKLVGGKTHGKYVASRGYKPTAKALQNWCFFPIIFSYTNANNESVKGGLKPHVSISENEKYLYPLGDSRECMLAAALNSIMPSTASVEKFQPQYATPINMESGMLIDNE